MNKTNRNSERGNILWFITLAVIFTALVTMAITRSSSNVEQTGNYEQNTIKISQILRHAKSIETAIQNLSIQGISINDISFENPVTTLDYTNHNCTDTRCRLFHPDGAGITYERPIKSITADPSPEWVFTGDINVGSNDTQIGTYGAPHGNDLIMILENMESGFCTQLNQKFKISNKEDIPGQKEKLSFPPYTGSFSPHLNVLDGTPEPYEFDNKRFGCFNNGFTDNGVTFFYVLLER